MRAKPFSRPTLIAAVELLEGHSQTRFNQMVLRLGLEDEIGSWTAVSVAKKCDILGRVVVQRSDQVVDTLDGTMTLGEISDENASLKRVMRPVRGLLDPARLGVIRCACEQSGELPWRDVGSGRSNFGVSEHREPGALLWTRLRR